ncbi:MAG: carboxypeptidase regulatory-like domain-containing protein [Rhodopirellula sp.]|nr:carboxypeptidase regulatory-like domain-containing protein [Rhodopirellula sp.]
MSCIRIFLALGTFGILTVVAGCGSGRPETAAVSGKVTLDGEPVEGATVALFHPDGGQPARGVTDASGAFVLTTFEAGDGALLGQHKVTVSKIDESAQQSADPSAELATPTSNADLSVTAKHLLPIIYSSPSTSDLTVDVKQGMEPIVLDLKSK